MMSVNMVDANGFKETEIGPIPVDWDVQPLRQVAKVRYGKARPKTTGNIPVLGSSGVYAWAQDVLVEHPTVVIGRKGSAGQVWYIDEPCWPSDTTFYLEWTADVVPQFVGAYLDLNKLSGEHAQTTLPSLQRPDLEAVLIPLPDKIEQRHIAAALNAIQDAIAAQEDVIAAAREFKRSLMQRLFTYGPSQEPAETQETEIGEIPKHWKFQSVKDLCDKIVDCPHSTPKYQNTGTLVVRNFNIKDGNLLLEQAFYTSEEEYVERTRRLVPEHDDVILSREAPIGEACVIPSGLKLCLGQRIMLLRPNPQMLNPYFLVYTFYSDNIQQLLHRLGKGVTAKHLNVGDVRDLKIPVAPLPEQDKIAELILDIERKIFAEEDRKTALQAFFNSALHQLMTGQIRLLEDEGLPL